MHSAMFVVYKLLYACHAGHHINEKYLKPNDSELYTIVHFNFELSRVLVATEAFDGPRYRCALHVVFI